jgi:hypothetical protein
MNLYNVRYFKGDTSDHRTISKHTSKEKAMIFAQKFIDQLVKQHDESGNPVIVECHEFDLSDYRTEITMLSLVEAKTNIAGDHDPVGEGVSISLIKEVSRAQDAFDIG